MNRLVIVVVLAVALVASGCSDTDGESTETSATEPSTTTTATIEPRRASTTTTSVPLEVSAAEGLGDSFYPYLGNGGYDVLHYDIDLDIDLEANRIQALTTITAQATEELSAFNLDLAGLTVHTVTVDETPAEHARYSSELVVTPADTLAAGTDFVTEVSYSGTPEPIYDPGVPFFELGWHNRDGVVFTASEPSGSMSWFPSNNHPTDKATFEISLTVPEPLTAASNGILVNETTIDGYTTTTWRMDKPMATYLAAVYVGDFERVETAMADGPLIRDYIPRADAEGIVEALSITPEAIRYFESLLGPYPYDVYGTIVMPFRLGFALENQTLSVHGRYAIETEIIAHEVLHQWLGNSSTIDDWRDIWLHEGFATYLTDMYLAEHHESDLDQRMREYHGFMVEAEAVPPRKISKSELFDGSVYLRGALTLHALRGFVGDTVFAEILRTHYQQSANGNTNTTEFLGIVTNLASPEAAELVESWLHDDPIPAL